MIKDLCVTALIRSTMQVYCVSFFILVNNICRCHLTFCIPAYALFDVSGTTCSNDLL